MGGTASKVRGNGESVGAKAVSARTLIVMATKTVTLKSKDGEEFQVDQDAAFMSDTIKNMIDDTGDTGDEAVPLPNVESSILRKVIEYCTFHAAAQKEGAKPDEEKDSWDAKFVTVDDEVLFNLILAANYLDIKSLLDLTCKKVAEYIKQCKTPEEIRKRFNIKNDFTPEEEEEVRRENQWCEDR